MTDCASVRAALLEGKAPDDPELAAHASGCEACRELLASAPLSHLLSQAHTAPDPMPQFDIEALAGRTLTLVQQERGLIARLRSISWRGQLALGATLSTTLLLVVLFGSPRPDLGVYPLARMVVTVGAYALVAGLGLALATRPLWKRPLGKLGLIVAWPLVLIPFVLAMLPAAHAAHPASLAGVGADFAPRAMGCFAFGSVLAIPVMILLGLSDRAGLSRTNLTLLLGTGAGFVGAISLEFHCPITHPSHLLIGHATVALAWTLVLLGLSAVLKQRRAKA